ncbi:MAG: hypothetical protein K9N51_09255 [Candidatus Pacebacteria bacterium]|nr:hypothetical protein [Candidatus Paceibacterota bacterium]
MRIVNEKYLSLVWSWDTYEKNGLQTVYDANIRRLVEALRKRAETDQLPEEEDIRALASELQQAGELLEQSMNNCLNAAQEVYSFAAADNKERRKRAEMIEQLHEHIGKPVILTQTSVPDLEGKQLILEDVHGIKAILRDGDDLWEALVDFLSPVLDYKPSNSHKNKQDTKP